MYTHHNNHSIHILIFHLILMTSVIFLPTISKHLVMNCYYHLKDQPRKSLYLGTNHLQSSKLNSKKTMD